MLNSHLQNLSQVLLIKVVSYLDAAFPNDVSSNRHGIHTNDNFCGVVQMCGVNSIIDLELWNTIRTLITRHLCILMSLIRIEEAILSKYITIIMIELTSL